MIDNTMIEARVRFGAVKGAQVVQGDTKKNPTTEVEEGHDEDLDDVVESLPDKPGERAAKK